jgi:hypothetical protein
MKDEITSLIYTFQRWLLRWSAYGVRHIRVSSVLLSTSAYPIQADSFLKHPHPETLLETTGLASLPSSFVYLAIIRRWTSVFNVT